MNLYSANYPGLPLPYQAAFFRRHANVNHDGVSKKAFSALVATGLLVFVGLVGSVGACTAKADDFCYRSPLVAKLTAPLTSIVDGRSFRDGINRIATQAGVSVWLDRRVDPSRPVATGPLGPTVYEAFEKLAASQGCVAMPVETVLIIGRPDWVDRTVVAVLELQLGGDGARAEAVANVSWSALATPTEALAAAVGVSEGEIIVNPPLPHDLWPEINWQSIDRRAAVVLVLSQFDRKPQTSDSLTRLQTVAADSRGIVTRRYRSASMADLRKAIVKADRKASIRMADGWLELTAQIGAHHAATDAVIGSAESAAKAQNSEQATFSLTTRASAANVFAQLVAAAGRKCVIDDSAKQACEQMVSINAKDQTLRQLIELVAEQAAVTTTWSENTVSVSIPKTD